jgi:hypothetical protein
LLNLDSSRLRGCAEIRYGLPNSMSTFELLELVALGDDKPDHGLCAGDVGTIVEVYDGEGPRS